MWETPNLFLTPLVEFLQWSTVFHVKGISQASLAVEPFSHRPAILHAWGSLGNTFRQRGLKLADLWFWVWGLPLPSFWFSRVHVMVRAGTGL